MLLLVLGPPAAVFARTATLVNDIEVEDSAAITFRFPTGALAVMSVSLGSQAEISRHRFSFEHLSAESGTEPYANGAEPWVFTATGATAASGSPRRSRLARSARTTPASSSASP